jgi:fused signal recognition particle receptor
VDKIIVKHQTIIMFNSLKNAFQKLYSAISTPLQKLFATSALEQSSFNQLRQLLIEADTGKSTADYILHNLQQKSLHNGDELKKALHEELVSCMNPYNFSANPAVFMLVGINGSGKTTCAAKLAYYYRNQGKKVLLVAADTFRAAAQEQIAQWAQKYVIDSVLGKEGQDPGAVIFAGCQRYKDGNYDILIIDTAGRLQTKINLMHELAKLQRIITRQLPDKTIHVLLTIDAMLGQNSFEQAKLFHECTSLNGVILTKVDGSGKGGIVFAINQQLSIPVAYISHGEKIETLMPFNPHEFVDALISS